MTRRALLVDEQAMRASEERIPEIAARAGRTAHERALQVAGKVIMVRGADLVEKHADGSVTVLRRIGEPVKVRAGQVLHRKR
jgi:hypothetical protein